MSQLPSSPHLLSTKLRFSQSQQGRRAKQLKEVFAEHLLCAQPGLSAEFTHQESPGLFSRRSHCGVPHTRGPHVLPFRGPSLCCKMRGSEIQFGHSKVLILRGWGLRPGASVGLGGLLDRRAAQF